jgi:hypothetical protein
MKSKKTIVLTGCIVAIFNATAANASVVYSYTGPNFTTILNPNSNTDTYATSQLITFSFTTDSYLPGNLSVLSYGDKNFTPISWTMSDGNHVNSPAAGGNLTGGQFTIFTNAAGEITGWDIFSIQTYAADSLYTVNMRTFQYPSSFNINNGTVTDISGIYPKDSSYDIHPINLGQYTGAAGQWSVTGTPSAVPIPATIWLFSSALTGLSLVGRRSKKRLSA